MPHPNLNKPGVIRPGFSAELDGVVNSSAHAREWVAGLEPRERERTGISSLKVGFNKVFGYYIEVTKANSDRVPRITSGNKRSRMLNGISPRS